MQPTDTQPFDTDAVQDPEQTSGRMNRLPLGLHVGKLSDQGKKPGANEDCLFTFESYIVQDYGEELFGLFIVADGMGGHAKGDVASSIAARTTADYLLREMYLPLLSSSNNSSDSRSVGEVLIEAIEQANTLVQEEAPEGGTTLTGTLIMGHSAYLVHVGDTRAYFYKEGVLKQITEDHSLAQRMRAAGQGDEEQLANIDHILYKAIGQGATVEPENYVQHLPPGSSLLLCSDGVWKGVGSDERIAAILEAADSPQAACQTLITTAYENEVDNLTAIVISMGLAE